MFIFKGNFWWIYLRYSIYIVHYTTLPLLEKRRLTCLWRGMWVFGNRLCLCPNFGLFRYAKLTRSWSRINICTIMMWSLAKNMTRLLESPKYIYNYGALLFWQTVETYLPNPMKSCLIIGSKYIVITMMILLLWQIVERTICLNSWSLCFGTDSIAVFTVCRITVLMCTTLLVLHSRTSFDIQRVPIFRMGTLASNLLP